MGKKAVSFLLYYLSVSFTAGMLALAVVCWRASYIDPAEGAAWVLLAFFTPVVLFVNGLLLIWWLIRRRWLVALLPIAAFAFNWGFVAAMVQPPRSPQNTESDLKVATFNVHGFNELDSKRMSSGRIAAMMREEQIDIACLQEVLDDRKKYSIDSILADFVGFAPHYARELSMAVFSRYPILDYHYRRFPDTNNSYFRADIDVKGRKVRFISVHLQTSGIAMMRRRYQKDYGANMPMDVMVGLLTDNARIRAEQVHEIRQLIDTSSMPLVVAGDFNDIPSSYAYRTLKGDLTDGFRRAGSWYGGSYRYPMGLLRIDYIFYNNYFDAVNYHTPDEEVLSDHKPVIAALRFAK